MAKRAVCVLNGDVKGTIYFDQEVSEEEFKRFSSWGSYN